MFAPLPELTEGQSGVLIFENAAGEGTRFRTFSARGAFLRDQFDAESHAAVRCAVLSGELAPLGLPEGEWAQALGRSRTLGELGIIRSLVLQTQGDSAEFLEDPSALSALARLNVPDGRSCAVLNVRPSDLEERAKRFADIVDLRGGRFLTVDVDGVVELHSVSGAPVRSVQGATSSFLRRLVYDASQQQLWALDTWAGVLFRASVPEGSFDALEFEADGASRTAYVRDLAGLEFGANPPALVLATLERAGSGSASVTLRSEGAPPVTLEMPGLDASAYTVRPSGRDEAYLYSLDALWRLRAGVEPERIAVAEPSAAIHSVRYSNVLGLLVGRSNGKIERMTETGLSTLLDVGGWWVLDVAPYERGLAYLLANGVVGQFIEGQGTCVETPVLGTLVTGQLVPGLEGWLVSGGLPPAGARFALLERSSD